jgi:hypothetical protein
MMILRRYIFYTLESHKRSRIEVVTSFKLSGCLNNCIQYLAVDRLHCLARREICCLLNIILNKTVGISLR